MDNDRSFKTNVSLYVFTCEHGKHCNFISDCSECAKAKIAQQQKRIAELERLAKLSQPQVAVELEDHLIG